jgi:hypothetical protein
VLLVKKTEKTKKIFHRMPERWRSLIPLSKGNQVNKKKHVILKNLGTQKFIASLAGCEAFEVKLQMSRFIPAPTIEILRALQGCQTVCFQTKNRNLGKFWEDLQWIILVYFMTIWSILRPLEMQFYGHLVYFMVIWYISPPFWYFVPRKIWQPWSLPEEVCLKRENLFQLISTLFCVVKRGFVEVDH